VSYEWDNPKENQVFQIIVTKHVLPSPEKHSG